MARRETVSDAIAAAGQNGEGDVHCTCSLAMSYQMFPAPGV
jgi:hypothetical protein